MTNDTEQHPIKNDQQTLLTNQKINRPTNNASWCLKYLVKMIFFKSDTASQTIICTTDDTQKHPIKTTHNSGQPNSQPSDQSPFFRL